MDSDTFMNQISLALSKPIQPRCADLHVLFQRGTIRDLQAIYPLLIDNIFGPQGTLSWGLRTITTTLKSHDFHTLQQFLSPCGPFFQLIYGLLKDPFIKYDFNIAFLPGKVRQMLESSNIHPFYADLIHINPHNKQVVSLMLNPFDYYMFHFAYHLINPWHQRSGIPLRSSWSTVYYILCCDYVLHFLPTMVGAIIQPVINYNGKNPVQQYQKQVARPAKISKLLKTNLFGEIPNDYNIVLQPLDKHPRSEIWRSETILTVFLDMWLNNDQISNCIEHNFNLTSTKQPLPFNELPAGEYIRITRVLVKQLHAFASSGKVDDSNLGELKKITLPMMQGKMYIFLRNLIHRWPLDGSFRLVLELWLSFIQPWRYPGHPHTKNPPTQPEVHPDMDDNANNPTKSVDREYLQFIAENILSYVVIFQQLLPRFLRVDLASPKNSLMLYRLTKVFDQPNLVPLIREIEYCIEGYRLSPTHSFSVPNPMPPLSPTSKWSSNITYYDPITMKATGNASQLNAAGKEKSLGSSKYTGMVRQKIYELEGPNFHFKPLFSGTAAQEVFELLTQIKKAERTAHNIVKARLDEIEKSTSGFFGLFKSLFFNYESSNDEFTLEERKKVPLYLNFSLQYLTDMFQINEHLHTEQDITPDNSFENQQNNIADRSIESFLTPQLIMERRKAIIYEGDPDLHPVRSNESKLLVRMFYHWATKINERYIVEISRLYYREDFIGRFSRQIILPPRSTHRYDKSKPGRSPRITEHLPPRISLRRFASHQFLAYAVIGILVSKFLNYSLLTFLFFILAIWFFVTCVRALRDKTLSHEHYAPGIDSSLNESF